MYMEERIIIVVSGIRHFHVRYLQDYRYEHKQSAVWNKVTQFIGEAVCHQLRLLTHLHRSVAEAVLCNLFA